MFHNVLCLKINNGKDTALFTQKQIKSKLYFMFYNIRKYLVCIVLSRTFVYVKFKKQIVMTKFIDNTKKNNSKKTVFEKVLTFDFAIENAECGSDVYEKVEFIGHDESYGDVFKAYHDANDDNNFTLFFGVKGSEFDEQ